MVFTRDLRIRDNPALAAAVDDGDQVVPLFVLDDAVLATAHGRPNRLGFLLESLVDLDASLRGLGGALVVRRGRWVDEVLAVARSTDALAIHLAADHSALARTRLGALAEPDQVLPAPLLPEHRLEGRQIGGVRGGVPEDRDAVLLALVDVHRSFLATHAGRVHRRLVPLG